ncbi:MAG: ATP-binding cassette domain-containing protein [Magnetococcales bacterium]|nr:ATP-binding cassette domain-containing protein [Magnetococcales bacterium]
MQTLLDAEGLTKRYQGRKAVCSIDFQVVAGECFGILGPNGAGKTTTLRMVMGMTPIDGGALSLFGEKMFPEHPTLRQRIGVVSQEDNLDIDLTVAENLLVYGRYFGLSDRVITDKMEEMLAFAQLEDRGDTKVRTLSGGMKRRLVIARSLVASPDMIILDEPTTGLDPQARHLIWQRLRKLKESGVTLVLTTHYMEEAAQLCDRLMVLDKGRILDQGSPRELIERHVEPDVVEIRRVGSYQRPDRKRLDGLTGRIEPVADTLLFYTDDTESLFKRYQGRKHTLLHRPTNLEDVFLKLTGRELRD